MLWKKEKPVREGKQYRYVVLIDAKGALFEKSEQAKPVFVFSGEQNRVKNENEIFHKPLSHSSQQTKRELGHFVATTTPLNKLQCAEKGNFLVLF